MEATFPSQCLPPQDCLLSQEVAAQIQPARSHGKPGFTLIELMVVIGIITVLMSLALPILGRAQQSQRTLQCITNLRHLATAFRLYETDYQRFPDAAATASPWEQSIAPYVTNNSIFRCPADSELYTSLGSSYDWRDSANYAASLAGRPLGQVRGNPVLVYDSLPSWHIKTQINIARLDGSAQSMDYEEAMRDLDQAVGDP